MAWHVLRGDYKPAPAPIPGVLIDETADTVADALFISKKRAHEINQSRPKGEMKPVPAELAELIAHCEHPNEAIFYAYIVGRMHELQTIPEPFRTLIKHME